MEVNWPRRLTRKGTNGRKVPPHKREASPPKMFIGHCRSCVSNYLNQNRSCCTKQLCAHHASEKREVNDYLPDLLKTYSPRDWPQRCGQIKRVCRLSAPHVDLQHLQLGTEHRADLRSAIEVNAIVTPRCNDEFGSRRNIPNVAVVIRSNRLWNFHHGLRVGVTPREQVGH